MTGEKLQKYLLNHPLAGDVDGISVGFIDFSNNNFEAFSFISSNEKLISSETEYFYDLASVTKPLTIGLIQFIEPDILNKNNTLLLNHQSGIPSWGLLARSNYREQIMSYEIKKNSTLYSDFGAIRAQLEFENQTNKNLYEECAKYWDEEVCHWSVVDKSRCFKTGERSYKPIVGDVHDPNAWAIKEKVSHAGLFSTLNGLCRTLLNLEKNFSLTSYFKDKIKKEMPERFINAWDRVIEKSSTFAGSSCSDYTVGHLGFTGTSFWVDCEARKGVVILSNCTRDGWYNKNNLNQVRRALGNLYWETR